MVDRHVTAGGRPREGQDATARLLRPVDHLRRGRERGAGRAVDSVLILFGDYHGTVRSSGFFWANPFYSRSRGGPVVQVQITTEATKGGPPASRSQLHSRNSTKVSLRAQSLNGERLKVNDKGGNPIEIAAIVIWRVDDTARALFDVEDYESYVSTQTESALRHLAGHRGDRLVGRSRRCDDQPHAACAG